MLRFIYIWFLVGKYSVLYILIKLKLSKGHQQKLLRNFFEDAGGSFVKFGQLLSLRVDVISKDLTLEMLNLLDNVRPFPYHFVKEIFVRELGATPEEIFKDFQKEPFASASFGQVHGAKLKDNTIVAVKILRPGIEDKLMVDFFIIDVLAFLADLFVRIEALPWKEFATEFKKWTLQELDYHTEAEHSEKLRNYFEGNSHIVIPKVYHHLSTRRILVADYIEGVHLSRLLRGLKDGRLNYEKLKKIGIDIKKSPKILTQELMRQYFFFGFFHADPHPGNIILLQNDKIALIDFGIVGEALPANQKTLVNFLKAAARFDFKEAIYYSLELAGEDLKQMLVSALPANVEQNYIDDLLKDIADQYGSVVEKMVFASTEDLKNLKKDYASLVIELLKATNKYRIKVPAQTVVFIRAFSILTLIAKQLDSEFLVINEIKAFFKKFPRESLPVHVTKNIPYKRLSRERALEKLNTWLAYLLEVDTNTYHLVNKYMSKYNFS